MRERWRCAAACALVVGALAGCGGLTRSHTEFRAGAVRSVSIDPTSATLSVGTTRTFTAQATDNRGLVIPSTSFEWRSFNTAVATVDANGTVTGVAPGVTNISAVESTTGMIIRAQVTVAAGQVVPSFDRDIKPLARLSCSCHEAGGSAAGTGPMSDLNNISQKGYVVPGNPDGSTYVTTGAGGAGHPGSDAWGTRQQQVRDWIQQGATP